MKQICYNESCEWKQLTAERDTFEREAISLMTGPRHFTGPSKLFISAYVCIN